MQDENNFDDVKCFGRLEAKALSGGIIVPITRVFYKPILINQYQRERGAGKHLTEEAEEAIKEAERIHQKYHQN